MTLDFRTWSDSAIAEFAHAHRDDFASKFDDGFVKATLDAIENNHVSIEKRSYGFAIVQHENRTYPQERLKWITFPPWSELTILYVAPEHEGQGYGRTLVAEVVAKYSKTRAMTLRCEGDGRRAFFEKCGFSVHDGSGGMYDMSTPDIPSADS